MKKLLLILLLLFPVHGALGEILTISCEANKKLLTGRKFEKVDPPIIKIHRIDLKKRIVNDFGPLDLLTDHYIHWHWYKSANEAGKEKIEYIKVNRYDGKLVSEISVDIPESEKDKYDKDVQPKIYVTFFAECKKISAKRKF